MFYDNLNAIDLVYFIMPPPQFLLSFERENGLRALERRFVLQQF